MTTTQRRATYDPLGDAPQVPRAGSKGLAWPAGGCADPTSAEYGAWLFQPAGDANAYYVPENDLILE